MFSDEQFQSMAPSSWYYVTADYHDMPLHPTWRTPRGEEAKQERTTAIKQG